MIDVTKIQDSFIDLVGFRQPYNPDYAILDANNQNSLSGYYVNDNPFAKIEYLKDSQDYKDISNADFNTFLMNLKRSSIANVCNQVFSDIDFIDKGLFYNTYFNKVDVDTLPTGFIGYKIENDCSNVAFTINKVILNFQGNGDIDLLLFDGLKPVQTKTISIASENQEEALDWKVYSNVAYVGYINNALAVDPFNRDNDNNISSTLNVRKINVKDHLTNDMFDESDITTLIESTGLNLDIVVYNDYTEQALSSKSLFSRAIYLDTVISCLQVYSASLRSSKNEQRANALYKQIMIEINGIKDDGSLITVKGLRPQFLNEITSIKKELLKLKEGVFGDGYYTLTEI